MPSTSIAVVEVQQSPEPTLMKACLRMVDKTKTTSSCSSPGTVMRGDPLATTPAPASATGTATASQLTIFRRCALVYMTFNLSSAVLAQFLTLYYKSKGFDGTVLGILSCLTPVTTFVMAPLWGVLLGRTETGEQSQFPILYLTMILSVIIRTSFAIFLPTPTNFLIIAASQGVFHAPIRPMLDALVMDHLSDRGVFGKVRLFGILGTGIGTSLGGYLLTLKSDVIIGNVDTVLRYIEGYISINSITLLSNLGHGLSGFDFLFIAQIILTIPLLYSVRALQVLNHSTSSNSLPPAAPEDTTTSTNSGTRQRTAVRMQDVAGYVVQETAHILFFTIVYVMGISGGVGDAFACKLQVS
jgi:hypothetical protein